VDAGIHILNLTGASNLDLSGSVLGNLALFPSGTVTGLTTIEGGATFTGGLVDTTALPSTVTKVDLPSSGNDTLTLSDVAGQHVTVTLGNGTNVLHTGGGGDTITVGSGSNTITVGGAGTTVNLGAHTGPHADGIHFALLPVGESTLTTADNVTGFNVATDTMHFGANITGGATYTYANDYKETNSDANVPALFLAVHTALATDVAVVYDTVSGNLFLDVNHDGLLTTADFEVHLTGVTHLASVNLDVLGA
jgi:hypothetical protein